MPLRSTRVPSRALRALIVVVCAAPLMADSCATLGNTIPVKAYSEACTQSTTGYPITMTPTSGTGRWQNIMGKTINARIIFTNSGTASSDCSTAHGTADLRGTLPVIISQIVLTGAQGSWHKEGDYLVARFGTANRWLTLRLPMNGSAGDYEGGTPAEGNYPAGSGAGRIEQRQQ